jgi:hypothetical protein
MKFPSVPENLEYHSFVNRPAQRSIPPLSAVLGVFALSLLLVSSSAAQFNGATSVSAHAVSAAPPTSNVSPRTAGLAPPTRGISPPTSSAVTHTPHPPHPPTAGHPGSHPRPRQNTNGSAYYYPYFYGVPYGVDMAGADSSGDNQEGEDDDANYQGGPTVFDRRGSGQDAYIPPSDPGPAHAQNGETSTAGQFSNEASQPPTTLVFKDGHQIEVENYAIVSQTLYDLTPGHPRRIALTDLDLEATQKQNDDRGIVFQLPPQSQAN